MVYTQVIFLIIIASVLGSFFNMLIHRLPKGEDIVFKRSHCPECSHSLGVLDLIPVFSFLFLRGKCRYCAEKIRPRYFAVEILTIILALSCWFWLGFSGLFFLYFFFLSVMLLIFFMDWEEQIIPDSLTFLLIGVGLGLHIWQGNFLSAFYGLLLGYTFFWLVGFLAKLYYKKEAMGGGDLKLAAAIGAYWGWQIAAMAIYFSFLFGGVVCVGLLLTKKKQRTETIPFGPFLVLGVVLALIFGDVIWKFYFG
jgi:leader peptidase (prepilin peptidase) / N-methyltransferase